MTRIRRALLSVSDKTDLVPFARGLRRLGVELLSTGGTARLLRSEGIPVREISTVTGYPEILGGRVKTLHPKVHGGILAKRQDRRQWGEAKRLGLTMIDLVVVNLYPFESVASDRKAPLWRLLEEIDIGGVALIRAAAKNFSAVAVVCRPQQYPGLLRELERGRGRLSQSTRLRLAVAAFNETAYYDTVIHQTLAHREGKTGARRRDWPERLVLAARRRQVLRYGENPHQAGAWYQWPLLSGSPRFHQLHGKELSFNNLLDLNAAGLLVAAFKRPAAAVIKHNDPCGVACAGRLAQAFRQAVQADPVSAFGGIVGLNRPVDGACAEAILAGGFFECILAPRFRPEALKRLRVRRNLRLIQTPLSRAGQLRRCVDFKQIQGGLLAQEPDEKGAVPARWRLVTGSHPTPSQWKDLLMAWTVARFSRSNAIVLVKGERTVGIGAGQPSRVESVRIALRKAGARARGAVLASDGFFPKADGPSMAVRAGVRAIVQPGGSIQDPQVIAAAKRRRVAMLLTGERHFRH